MWQDESARASNICEDMSKIILNSPILRDNHEFDSIVVNKGRIHGELRYFWYISWNLIKSDYEYRWEIREFDKFRKITQIRIHGIKNHSIWIKIRGEIKEPKVGKILEHEERENRN